jgi:uncharacterized protein (TIGR02145 family)
VQTTDGINIGSEIYLVNGTNDCSCIDDGWYFTSESSAYDFVFHVVDCIIVEYYMCYTTTSTSSTTTSTTTREWDCELEGYADEMCTTTTTTTIAPTTSTTTTNEPTTTTTTTCGDCTTTTTTTCYLGAGLVEVICEDVTTTTTTTISPTTTTTTTTYEPCCYGLMYNWYAATDARNIAPVGWHVPTNTETNTLINYLGGNAVAGGKMKSLYCWEAPNTGATNESGFNVRGSGSRRYGIFGQLNQKTTIWTSHEFAYVMVLYYNSYDSPAGLSDNYKFGNQIRCLLDGVDPSDPGSVTDIDGNVYPTVKIGTQVWMAENLKVTHYNEGTLIPEITDPTEWSNLVTGALCAYDNDWANVCGISPYTTTTTTTNP